MMECMVTEVATTFAELVINSSTRSAKTLLPDAIEAIWLQIFVTSLHHMTELVVYQAENCSCKACEK